MAGKISAGHARALASLEKASLMMDALEVVERRGLNVRKTEELVKAVREGRAIRPAKPARPTPSPTEAALEARFRDALSTKVTLKRGRRGGTLTIHFKNDEDLEHLYRIIVGDYGD
jgi:ParB family chromosome partitioning protein